MQLVVQNNLKTWIVIEAAMFQLGMDGYPAPVSGSGRFSTNRWNPPPAGLYVARRVGFSEITVPHFALSLMSLRN